LTLWLAAWPAASLAQDGDPAEAADPLKPQGVAVTEQGTVELHVAELPLSEVLQLLSLEGERNIIASPNVTGTVTANLYGVTFEEALEAILTANGAGYHQVGNFIYVYTNEELAQMAAAARGEPVTRVFPLSYVNAADAKSYITPIVGEIGTVTASPTPATGLESRAAEGGGEANAARDLIIVTAPPQIITEVERILKEVDVRPRQVLVEATILRAELSDQNALGVDFTIVGGVDLELLSAVSNGIQDITLGPLPQDRFERFNANASTDFAGDVPDGGLTIGIIKDHVAIFLRALEQVTDTTVLANPKVLALNKQKGQVIVGRRDGFMTTTVTETQAVQTVEYLETGTQLIFRPFIADDGFVRMELHPEDSVGFVNAQGLPSEQTTEVTTNVLVRDGETILLGGLFREVTTDTKKQIPIVGNLPGVGELFRSKEDSTDREEVIILLTVHIVKDSEAFADASLELYENVERIRVGIRRGLMWHGRERLAQTQYRKALDKLAAGDSDKALWHANMALHSYPRFLPALQLKGRILGEREWDEDANLGRSLLHRLIAGERGYDLTPFGRPPRARIEPEEAPASTGAERGDSSE
jgi:type IV pilus assembly protein PilQ